jgi:hypothetical protein
MHEVNHGTSIAAPTSRTKYNNTQKLTERNRLKKLLHGNEKNKDDGRKLRSLLLLSELFACHAMFSAVVDPHDADFGPVAPISP